MTAHNSCPPPSGAGTAGAAYVLFDDTDLNTLARRLGPSHPITMRVRDALENLTDAEVARYRRAALNHSRDGEIEIDPNTLVSKADAPGAYVMAWLWIDDDELLP